MFLSSALVLLYSIPFRSLSKKSTMSQELVVSPQGLSQATIVEMIQNALSANTLRAYQMDLKIWQGWILSNDLSISDALSIQGLIQYLHAIKVGRKSSTISRYLSSIAFFAKCNHFDDRTKHPYVQLTLKAIRKEIETATKQAVGFSQEMVNAAIKGAIAKYHALVLTRETE
ncbi:hypothetical protein CCP3SC1AL1_2810001 [Gammaproteobacteria bacterium]